MRTGSQIDYLRKTARVQFVRLGWAGEDWENEAASVLRQNFTLKCTTSTPDTRTTNTQPYW